MYYVDPVSFIESIEVACPYDEFMAKYGKHIEFDAIVPKQLTPENFSQHFDLSDANAIYCEGVVSLQNRVLPIPHSWCLAYDEIEDNLFGYESIAYAGIKFTSSQMRRIPSDKLRNGVRVFLNTLSLADQYSFLKAAVMR